MRKMVLAPAITALPFLVNAAEDEFYGTYTLISTSRTRLDNGKSKHSPGSGLHHVRQEWPHDGHHRERRPTEGGKH